MEYNYLVTMKAGDTGQVFEDEFMAVDSNDAWDKAQAQYEEAVILAACRLD